jgi:hypothetical protein
VRISEVVFARISMNTGCSLWDLSLEWCEQFADDVGIKHFGYATRLIEQKRSERPIEVAIRTTATHSGSDVAELQTAATRTTWGIAENRPVSFDKCHVKLCILNLLDGVLEPGFWAKNWIQIAIVGILKIFAEKNAVDLCRRETMETATEFALPKVEKEHRSVLECLKDLLDAAERLNDSKQYRIFATAIIVS